MEEIDELYNRILNNENWEIGDLDKLIDLSIKQETSAINASIRNKLSPIVNVIELIESFKKGEIDASILTTELTAYQPILQHSVDKLLEIGG
jgi:hypothetical protein